MPRRAVAVAVAVDQAPTGDLLASLLALSSALAGSKLGADSVVQEERGQQPQHPTAEEAEEEVAVRADQAVSQP